MGVLLVLFGGGCAFVVYQLNHLSFEGGRKHLDPIPVSPAVCPYVRVMHDAANNFERVYGDLNPFAGFTPSVSVPGAVAWPTERARLMQSLNVLEFAVVVGRPQFPARIRQRLGIVVTSIRTGRQHLEQATSAGDLLTRLGSTYADGQDAFGDASDLIGDACPPVHLAADPAN